VYWLRYLPFLYVAPLLNLRIRPFTTIWGSFILRWDTFSLERSPPGRGGFGGGLRRLGLGSHIEDVKNSKIYKFYIP